MIGGSRFVGRHLVAEALSRGHEVTMFNRGRSGRGLFPQVEEIHGDRDGGLDALGGSAFDAVADTSGYVPRIVEQSATRFAGSVPLYLFVSSVSVYRDDQAAPITEDSAVRSLPEKEAGSEDVSRFYGELKVACEEVVREAFGRGAIVLRPGVVVGPHDPTNRFTYWVARIARGGEVLAPEPREHPVQVVDARDLGALAIRLLEASGGGTYNVTAPWPSMTMEGMLRSILAATEADARLCWASSSFLLEHGVQPWREQPLWVPEGESTALMQADPSRAGGRGLAARALEETVRDTLAWVRSVDEPPGDAGMDPERELALLEALDREPRAAPRADA